LVQLGNHTDPTLKNPIIFQLIRRKSLTEINGIISLHNLESMAGHFTVGAAAPIAILVSNALLLIEYLQRGKPKKFYCETLLVTCKRLAVAGEVLEVCAKRLREWDKSHDDMTHSVEFLDEQGGSACVLEYPIRTVGAFSRL
jgi:hypothetical protein